MISADAAEELLGILCVTYGFCLHSPAYDELCDSPPARPEEFLDAVIRADGTDPGKVDGKMYQAMLKEVRRAFGHHS